MNHRIRAILIAVVVLLMSSHIAPTHAAPDRAALKLRLLEEIEGTFDGSAAELRYSLSLYEGQVFSVVGWPEQGDLSLDIRLYDPSGAFIAEETTFEFPLGAYSVIEAIIPAQTGDYEIIMTPAGQTSGDFGLMAVPGYGFPVVMDHFDGLDGDLGLTWSPIDDPDLFSGIVNDTYLLQLKWPDLSFMIMSDDLLSFEGNLYVEVDVHVETEADNYICGLALRANGIGDHLRYYQVGFTGSGKWAVWVYENGEHTRLSDVQPSPLIDLSDPNARIGVLIEDYTFSVFFNGQLLGRVTDPDQQFLAGGIGFLTISTPEPAGLPVSAYYDNLVVTMPTRVVAASMEDNAENDASGTDVGAILGQSNGSQEGAPDALPFDLGGKTGDLPAGGFRLEGLALP